MYVASKTVYIWAFYLHKTKGRVCSRIIHFTIKAGPKMWSIWCAIKPQGRTLKLHMSAFWCVTERGRI
ncbi:UNVERIFIED_CONTAM: hypothetical protein FKN15_001328 [Acipenser sinensis]